VSEGPPDVILVRAAQSGDAASLGALLERHRARMLALAVGILGHGPQAEDAVQDACLIAVRRVGELRDPSAARAWLLMIVTNACRAQLRRPTMAAPTDANEVLDAPTPDTVERAIEQSALLDWLWTALERLSEPLRLVVILRYFSGADSYEAIAALCGVPVGTVRSRLNAAKANLAEELLSTAAQQHVHPGGLHNRHGLQIAEAMTAFERDGDQRALADAFAPDLGFVMFDRVERSGLENFAAALAHDYDDGLTVRPIRMVTSSDITVLEAWLDSPPENPLHCPPALTQIYHHPNGPTRRLVSHYAPREPRPAPTATQPQPGCRS